MHSWRKIIKSAIHTEKKATHRSSGYCLVTFCTFDKSQKRTKMLQRRRQEQANKIINYEKKEMILLTDEEKETHENQKNCYICEQEFCTDKDNNEF